MAVPLARRSIHEPETRTVEEQERSGSQINLDYPAPIVDHRQAREEYLDLGTEAKVGR